MSTRNRILIFGATGAVGRHLVAQLRDDQEVRALVRDPISARLPSDVDIVVGDLTVPASLHQAISGCSAVFLVWPLASVKGLDDLIRVIAGNTERIVYLSSAVPREHERKAEELIRDSGVEWTFLRPRSFASNTLWWAERIRAGLPVREPFARAAMALIDPRDVARVAARALTLDGHHGAVYELTGPEAISKLEQTGVISETIGRSVLFEESSPADARVELTSRGWPSQLVDEILLTQRDLVENPDPTTPTVENVTGTPPGSFQSWVTDHAHRFKTTMKAARIGDYGDADVIHIEETPLPMPGDGEVLIRVAGYSFNPSETALRAGGLHEVFPLEFPYTLGWDVSGTVVEQFGRSDFAIGDKVIGRLDRGGAAAEYVVAPVADLAKAPTTVSLADAAAIPVAGLASWQAVIEHARVSPGQTVLINGAGGAVGRFAVQLAKRAGARVIATASKHSAATISRYGADQTIDYTITPLHEAVDDRVDVLLNLVPTSPDITADLATLVSPGGSIVSITSHFDSPPRSNIKVTQFVARNDPEILAAVVEAIDRREIIVEPAERRPLGDVPAIHSRSENGEIHGKVVFTL